MNTRASNRSLSTRRKTNWKNWLFAKIQSTESSNKIEGIISTNTRIKQLVQYKITPRNRDEKKSWDIVMFFI